MQVNIVIVYDLLFVHALNKKTTMWLELCLLNHTGLTQPDWFCVILHLVVLTKYAGGGDILDSVLGQTWSRRSGMWHNLIGASCPIFFVQNLDFAEKMFSLVQIHLSVLLVLTITTLSYAAHAGLPKVAYVKALDIWTIGKFCFQRFVNIDTTSTLDRHSCVFFLSGCLMFVFMSMVQTTLVNFCFETEATSSKCNMNYSSSHTKYNKFALESANNNGCSNTEDKDRINSVVMKNNSKGKVMFNQVSRVAFPSMFVLFNFLYWGYFLILTQNRCWYEVVLKQMAFIHLNDILTKPKIYNHFCFYHSLRSFCPYCSCHPKKNNINLLVWLAACLAFFPQS